MYDDVEGAGAGDHANTYMIHAAMPLNRKKNWAGIFRFQTGLTLVCSTYFVTFKLDKIGYSDHGAEKTLLHHIIHFNENSILILFPIFR